jgi:hypothetical protein
MLHEDDSGRISPPDRRNARRDLIVHYHLFKNAGSSIDEILKQNFGDRWGQSEFPRVPGVRSNSGAVGTYLQERPELLAFSSHTAMLPVPQLEGVRVHPIVFLRHPIDRIRSAYDFERKQNAKTRGAELAKQQDFVGYLRTLLKFKGNPQVKNFQAGRLAQNEPLTAGSVRERALRALRILPFVGLVEAYDRSMERLELQLKLHFPDFRVVPVHKNAGRPTSSSLEERLAAVKASIGTDLFDELLAANEDDLAIYQVVKSHYEADSWDAAAEQPARDSLNRDAAAPLRRGPRDSTADRGVKPVVAGLLTGLGAVLDRMQVGGSVCQIGASRARFFLALDQLRRGGEAAVVIDLFAGQASPSHDTPFRKAVQKKLSFDPAGIMMIAADLAALAAGRAEDLVRRTGLAKIVAITGDCAAADMPSCLSIAAHMLAEGGFVLLGNYKDHCRSVDSGNLAMHLSVVSPKLAPVAAAGDLLVLASAGRHEQMLSVLRRHLSEAGIAVGKRSMFGTDMLVLAGERDGPQRKRRGHPKKPSSIR